MEQAFEFTPALLQAAKKAEEKAKDAFARVDEIAFENEKKVLSAFHRHNVSAAHLLGTTGYGYDDLGRDALDKICADILGTEDALVRQNFVSGTHTIATALFGVLRPGDRLVAVTGAPYDTLEEVIGIRGEGNGSLKDFGVLYEEVPLNADGFPDLFAIREKVKGAKVAHLQRSRGYALRPSFPVKVLNEVIDAIREVSPETIIFVDNCYGELVEKEEPKADLLAGSLIKNLGGGIAPTGGYIAGKKELVELCGYRLTTPGIGREAGCTLDMNRSLYMGFFFAPSVVASAVKTGIFASALLEDLGFAVTPSYDEPRTDLITAVELKTKENMIAFCQGIQQGSPIDSNALPTPWAMPGYQDEVIMAAGAFTMGASIELSADGPVRPPYAIWLQGGLTYNTGKLGVLKAVQRMMDKENQK